MKINNKKIVVPALAMAMAAALAGSIAGSVAWYQYSTRATSMLNGTTAGSSRHLQLANVLDNDEADNNQDDTHWGYNYAPEGKEKFAPSTALFDEGVVTGFASHPVYQHFNNWLESPDDNYFAYDLYFQSIDEKKQRENLDVYLTAIDLRVENAEPGADTDIIKEALRVELVPYTFDGSKWNEGTKRLLSQSADTTELSDYLNLNKEDNYNMDRDGFAADDSMGNFVKYKANTPVVPEADADLTGLFKDSALTKKAGFNKVHKEIGDSGADLFTDEDCTIDAADPIDAAGDYYEKVLGDGSTTYYKANLDSYTTESFENIVANDDNPYNITGGVSLFETAEDYAVKLTVKIWLEGWQRGEAEANVLPAGTEATGYYNDDALTEAAENKHSVEKNNGDSAKGLYTDNTLSTPAANYHSVDKSAGDPMGDEQLYTDPACENGQEVTLSEGKIAADGTYYARGVAAGTYWTNGVAAGTYYSKGYIWNSNSIGTTFNLGLRFAVEAEQ